MSRRTVLITGGTSGLGLRTAAEIARDPSWHVVLTGRDQARAAAAATPVGAEALTLDLGSLADVRRFAMEFAEGERPRLHALVCNAGVQHISGPATSKDGYEATFAVNHLGHFLLANLLLDELAPGRVVVVSSDTHDPAKRSGMPAPRFELARELASADETWARDDGPATAGRRKYTTSKLCNILFAYEAARRWEDRGVMVNAFNPGLMPGTGLAREYPPYQQLIWRYVMPALTVLLPGANTVRKSGKALARLVTDPGLDSTSGSYWSGATAIASSADSYDARRARELWELSDELTGLSGDSVTDDGTLRGHR